MIGLDTLFVGGQLIFHLIEMELMIKVKVMRKSTFCVNNVVCLVPYGLSWARLAHVVASVSVALQTPEASCAPTSGFWLC